MENSTSKSILALIAGIGIGIGLGILFAPDKGTNTREKLKKGFDDKKHQLQDILESQKNELLDKTKLTKATVEESFDNLISGFHNKADDAIVFLENKLAELKKQNAKYKK